VQSGNMEDRRDERNVAGAPRSSLLQKRASGIVELRVVVARALRTGCFCSDSLFYSIVISEGMCTTPSAEVLVSLYKRSVSRCSKTCLGVATLGCKGQLCDGTFARGTGITHDASTEQVKLYLYARGANTTKLATPFVG
jgi:hypothetical protein